MKLIKKRKKINESQQRLMRQRRMLDRDVGRHPHTTQPELKTALRYDLHRFLIEVFPDKFDKPFSDEHLIYIRELQDCILHGGTESIAMPRGDGKTTIAMCSGIWAIAYGHRQYFAVIAATDKLAQNIVSGVKTALETNTKIAELFPEISHYARALEGQAQRAKSQLADGELTRMRWNTDRIVLASYERNEAFLELSPQGIFQAAGLTGSIRGFNYALADGRTIRPDFVLIDDPQTRESAESPAQTEYREKLINGDVMCLGGVGIKIAAVMACTIICENDLSERFLKKWRSRRSGWLTHLPDEDGKQWCDYMELYRELKDLPQEDRQQRLNDYYQQNRDRLDAGGRSSWEERRFPGDLSSLQSAYNKRAEIGDEAFFCEYQNQPLKHNSSLYEITPELIRSKLSGFRRGELPQSVNCAVIAADINYHGISWVYAGFRNDFAGFVLDYGIWPGNKPICDEMANEESAIYEALNDFVNFIRSKYPELNAFGIDGNRFTAAVLKFIRQFRNQVPFRFWPMRGLAATQYRPENRTSPRLVGTNRTNCHLRKSISYPGVTEALFDSHYWHYTMQRAWLLTPGGRGSMSLYGDGRSSHRIIAEQICADRLKDLYERGGKQHYEWKTTGRNDLGDALTMGCVLANLCGVEVDGVKIGKRLKKKRTRAKITNYGG